MNVDKGSIMILIVLIYIIGFAVFLRRCIGVLDEETCDSKNEILKQIAKDLLVALLWPFVIVLLAIAQIVEDCICYSVVVNEVRNIYRRFKRLPWKSAGDKT